MTDAVARLVACYRQAAGAMQGLPICNAALAVEAVGFREHDGRHVGVIVTPWFMNLTVMPSSADLVTWRQDQLARLAFPSGRYDFVVSEVTDGRLIATCSLFSPMHDFADHAEARAAALAAIDALFERETPPVLSRRKFFGG